jgi:hypothetical protein
MQKNTVVFLAAVVLGQTFALPVALAQAPTVTAARSAPSNCPYEMCALRAEPGFFGGRVLVVGVDGVRTNFGIHAGGLISVVDRVPAALTEAQLGRRNAVVSTIAGFIGAIGIGIALNGTTNANIDKVGDGQFFGALAVGATGAIVAVVQRVFAERHFSRSVWLYNRELTH